MHDQTFKIKIDKTSTFTCVLNQGGTPVNISFPDKDSSLPVVELKLLVYCDMEDIIKLKKAEFIKLII